MAGDFVDLRAWQEAATLAAAAAAASRRLRGPAAAAIALTCSALRSHHILAATVNLLCAAVALKDARDLRALSSLTVAEVNTLERDNRAERASPARSRSRFDCSGCSAPATRR